MNPTQRFIDAMESDEEVGWIFEDDVDDFTDLLVRPLEKSDWKQKKSYLELILLNDPKTRKFSPPKPIERYTSKEIKSILKYWESLPSDKRVLEIRVSDHEDPWVGFRYSWYTKKLQHRLKELQVHPQVFALRERFSQTELKLMWFTFKPKEDIIVACSYSVLEEMTNIPSNAKLFCVLINLDGIIDQYKKVNWYLVNFDENTLEENKPLKWSRDFASQNVILSMPHYWDKPDLLSDKAAQFAISVFRRYEKGYWIALQGTKREWDIEKILSDFGGFIVDGVAYIRNENLIEITECELS